MSPLNLMTLTPQGLSVAPENLPLDQNGEHSALIQKHIRAAVSAWRRFYALDEPQKMQLAYRKDQYGFEAGYQADASPAGQKFREDFYFACKTKGWMEDAVLGERLPIMFDFLFAADQLMWYVRRLVERAAICIEESLELPGFRDDIMAGEDFWFLRFLHYPEGQEVGTETATAHADRDAFSVRLYESESGLEFLDYAGRWHEKPLEPGTIGVFPGMKLQYRSEGRVTAACHRVVTTQATADRGRDSIILFVHPANTPNFNKGRFGRLQEFPPGWNYDMSWERFREFFVG